MSSSFLFPVLGFVVPGVWALIRRARRATRRRLRARVQAGLVGGRARRLRLQPPGLVRKLLAIYYTRHPVNYSYSGTGPMSRLLRTTECFPVISFSVFDHMLFPLDLVDLVYHTNTAALIVAACSSCHQSLCSV